jgi:hypothetical protein
LLLFVGFKVPEGLISAIDRSIGFNNRLGPTINGDTRFNPLFNDCL